MTEIERKALALIAEVKAERGLSGPDYLSARAALIRAIEQHEAFKREVSDAINTLTATRNQFTFARGEVLGHLASYIIPDPVDPLIEALCDAWPEYRNTMGDCKNEADKIRQALAARGLKIVEVE